MAAQKAKKKQQFKRLKQESEQAKNEDTSSEEDEQEEEEEAATPLTRINKDSDSDSDSDGGDNSEDEGETRSKRKVNVEFDWPRQNRVEMPLPPSVCLLQPGVKWSNKERVLVFGTRGISYRDRHLMEDLKTLLPHSKSESKMQRKETLFAVNEIAEMKNCNKCLMFEGRRKRDLYLWAANIARGPSAKFLVENVHTMSELKLTGNCLKSSRPLLSFDPSFEKEPHLMLLKELLTQVS